MLWKKGNRINKTLVFKLTIQYILLYSILNIIIIAFVFYKIKTEQNRIIDNQIIIKVKSALKLINTNKPDNLTYALCERSVADGVESTFYLLLDSTHSIMAESYIKPWGDLTFLTYNIPVLPDITPIDPKNNKQPKAWKEGSVKIKPELLFKENWELNYILYKSLGQEQIGIETRSAYIYLPQGKILVIGISLEENKFFISQIQRFVIYFFILSILLGAWLGYFVASKSMKDVVNITKTVNRIQKGDLSLRVKHKSNSEEIFNLAMSFNNMLNRIENLIIEQKQLTNDIAHDLRSPITGIRGLSETSLTGKQRDNTETFGQIISECDRLINMINSALVISEIEAGMFQKAKNSFNIHELLNHAYAVFLDVARLKGISLHKNIPEQEVIINGHNSLLQRAIANIIDNAIKFSDFNGEVTICSRIEGQNIFIEIKDTGIGIQKEEQLKIFNKFYKVNRSRSDTGNGLGLSIAKAYIDLHHGRIVVDSLPDRGTAFTILLPLTEKQNT